MKKFWSIFLALMLCLSVCVGLVGCNFRTDVPSGDNKVDDEKNTNAEVNLSVGILQGTYERYIMLKWKNAFQKLHPEVSIEITAQFGEMAYIKQLDSGNQIPDIMWTAGDQHSPYSKDYFIDLREMDGATEFFSDFYDTLIDSTHYSTNDKGIWFVPRDYNALVVYYNETLFEEAGVDLPQQGWTWDDFIATCEALMSSGKVLKAVEYDMAWPPFIQTMMAHFGSEYFNDDGTIALDSAETQECFNYLREFNDKYAIQGTSAGFSGYTANGGKNIGMFIDVRPSLPELAEKAAASNWKMNVVSFPNFQEKDAQGSVVSQGYVGVGCSGYAITQKCASNTTLYAGKTKQEWAWEFLKYCMSEAGYEEAATQGVLVPALKSLAGKGVWRDYAVNGVKVNADAFIRTDATPIFLNYYNIQNPSFHADIISAAGIFWGNAKGASADAYTPSMNFYLTYMKDKTGITK